jgi:hypothetical protein
MHTSNPLRLLGAAALAAVAGCGSPDPEQTGFVILDDEARAAGIVLETDGEQHGGALPIAVDPGVTAILEGPNLHEPLHVGPREVVEIRGAGGEIVRDRATDRLVITSSESGARLLADMLDAQLGLRRDGRYELHGSDLLLIASMLDAVPEVLGASALAPSDWVFDPTGSVAAGMPKVSMDAPQLEDVRDVASARGPALEPASVVGVYRAASVTMVLDAAGGYRTTVGEQEVQRGSWSVLGSSVILRAAGSSTTTRLGVTDHSVFDASGAEFVAGGEP